MEAVTKVDIDSLSKNLSFLSTGDQFGDPFSNEIPVESVNTENELLKKPKGKKKKENQSFSDKISKKMEKLLAFDDLTILGEAEEFDNSIDELFNSDEDDDLKNQLIGFGRKYARSTVSEEEGEISKAFAPQINALNKLMDDLSNDRKLVQKDIDMIRSSRTGRNFKTLSELLETKTSMHTTTLQAIKEISNIKKAQFDLTLKSKKEKNDAVDDSTTANLAVQRLLGFGHDNLLSTVGGRAASSGAIYTDVDGNITSVENELDSNYEPPLNENPNEDGDIFLKYEGRDPHYILICREDGSKDIITEDCDGNILYDYPTPRNITDLSFKINSELHTATDQYNRVYEVRTEEIAEL